MFAKILSWFRPKPQSTEQITSQELRMLLHMAHPHAKLYLSDRTYRLCCMEDVRRFLKRDKTNRYKYIGKNEEYDCDDFAYRLMGQFSIPGWSALAFGIIWTKHHALNCLIDEEKNFWFIEPQTDGLSRLKRRGQSVYIIMM